MNPYMRYLHLLRRKAAVVIKDCPYLSLIDGKVRLAILSMLASEWQTSTSVHLCETATSVITVVYAALGHSDVELYNHEIRRLMSPPKYLTPVGGFPVHALLLQFQAVCVVSEAYAQAAQSSATSGIASACPDGIVTAAGFRRFCVAD
jgi:hypothetical protein